MFEHDIDQLNLAIPHVSYPFIAEAIGLGAKELLIFLQRYGLIIIHGKRSSDALTLLKSRSDYAAAGSFRGDVYRQTFSHRISKLVDVLLSRKIENLDATVFVVVESENGWLTPAGSIRRLSARSSIGCW